MAFGYFAEYIEIFTSKAVCASHLVGAIRISYNACLTLGWTALGCLLGTFVVL